MHVVLFQPEIPPNTGNVARLCAAMQVSLHLIEPLGFKLEDRYLKRAGLDYWPHVDMAVWPDLDAYIRNAGAGRRLVLTSARRGAALHRFEFTENDSLVFGRETSGLPPEVIGLSPHHVRIPIKGNPDFIILFSHCLLIPFLADPQHQPFHRRGHRTVSGACFRRAGWGVGVRDIWGGRGKRSEKRAPLPPQPSARPAPPSPL